MVPESISNSPLKIVFFIHMFLSSWGMQGNWSPNSYFFYTTLLFIALFWAIRDKESADPIELALAINFGSILLDIIILIIYFPSSGFSAERFSSGMAILNLLARPVTSVVLYNILAQRRGLESSLPNSFGNFFGNQRRTVYDDIDGVQQSVPGAQGSSGQSAAPFYSPIGGQGQEKMPPPYLA